MRKLFLRAVIIFVVAVSFTSLSFAETSLGSIEMRIVNDWRLNGGIRSDLQRGSFGPEVRILQYTLSRSEEDVYPSNLITGFFGEKTEEGVKNWQKLNDLPSTGRVDKETRDLINSIYFSEMCPVPTEDYPDKKLIPIGKDYMVSYKYIPENLIDISEMVKTTSTICLEERTALKLQEMFEAAKEEDVVLAVTSGFRRFEIQDIIHRNFLSRRGEATYDFSAKPGHSEHHLGTTVDLTGSSIGYRGTSTLFADSKEKEWLKENARMYGFVLSYPKNSMEVTGYIYEPWHFRYVGVELATEMWNQGYPTLEEFFGLDPAPVYLD